MQKIATRQKIRKRDDLSETPNLDLATLFQEHYSRIYNYLRYRVTAPEDAEDLISIIFERAYTHRAQFNPTKGTFSTWLFRIAHNALVDHYRIRKRHTTWETEAGLPADLVTPEPSPEAQIVQQETVAQLLQGVASLSERDQEIITLKFAGRLKNKEIGEIINMKEKTVSVALLRAMRRLRQQMIKEAAL